MVDSTHPAQGSEGETRRDFLYLMAGAVGAVGTVAAVIPMINSMNPSAEVLALTEPLACVVRAARKALGTDAIVGSFCGTSSHDGMTAGEAGADYVSFGPVGTTALGDGTTAPLDLFHWWSEMIEVPVVAEGALSSALIAELAEHTDFLGISEIWREDDPVAALRALRAEAS